MVGRAWANDHREAYGFRRPDMDGFPLGRQVAAGCWPVLFQHVPKRVAVN